MTATAYLLDTNICAFYLRGKFDIDQHIDKVGWENCLRLAGTPCDDNFDLLIACTAISNGMVCVTDNVRDFCRFENLQLENWVARP